MRGKDYAEWLKAQFVIHKDDKEKSKAKLAKVLGLEPSGVSKIINKTRQVKAHEYAIMLEFFGHPPEKLPSTAPSLHAGFGDTPRSTKPSQMHDQEPLTGDWNIPTHIAAHPQQGNKHNKKTGNLITMPVTDHFMEPEFMRDDLVLVDTQDTAPHPPGVFVVSDKFTHMLRHCAFAPNSSKELKLTTNSKDFHAQTLSLDDFEIIGRVVAKMQWL